MKSKSTLNDAQIKDLGKRINGTREDVYKVVYQLYKENVGREINEDLWNKCRMFECAICGAWQESMSRQIEPPEVCPGCSC